MTNLLDEIHVPEGFYVGGGTVQVQGSVLSAARLASEISQGYTARLFERLGISPQRFDQIGSATLLVTHPNPTGVPTTYSLSSVLVDQDKHMTYEHGVTCDMVAEHHCALTLRVYPPRIAHPQDLPLGHRITELRPLPTPEVPA